MPLQTPRRKNRLIKNLMAANRTDLAKIFLGLSNSFTYLLTVIGLVRKRNKIKDKKLREINEEYAKEIRIAKRSVGRKTQKRRNVRGSLQVYRPER